MYKAAVDDQKPHANSTCRSQSLGCRNRCNTALEISTRVVLITSAAMPHADITDDRLSNNLLRVRYYDHVHKLYNDCSKVVTAPYTAVIVYTISMEFFPFEFAVFHCEW